MILIIPEIDNEIDINVKLRAGHEVIEPFRYDGVLGF